jgi:hypothetical protein
MLNIRMLDKMTGEIYSDTWQYNNLGEMKLSDFTAYISGFKAIHPTMKNYDFLAFQIWNDGNYPDNGIFTLYQVKYFLLGIA